MQTSATRSGTRSILRVQCDVLIALILRDVRTRFFGHGAGYLIAVAWPLAHIAILLFIYAAAGRVAPQGGSQTLYITVALAPVMAFIYSSRWIMLSAVMNKPLLGFPLVKLFDVLFARSILETLCSCLMVIVLAAVLTACGIDVRPRSSPDAFKAMAAAMLLGIGIGFVNGLLALLAPLWVTGYALLIIVIYMTSGVLFVPEALPEQARYVLSFNPILHAVEWMREAYYGVHSRTLDKTYLLGFGSISLFIGLVSMRFGRAFLLHSR